MYLVVIEWDGRIPSTTYYNRLHKLGLSVRGHGGKDLDPIQRRQISDGSVIAQEGAVLCASRTLAESIASYAQEDGAKEVSIGTVNVDKFYMTTESARIIQKIESVLGQRGRKSGVRCDWSVTCFEEMRTYFVEDQYAIVNCPHCSGLNVKARTGSPVMYPLPAKGDILSAWIRKRFATGSFELPMSGEEVKTLPPVQVVADILDDQRATVEIMRKSTEFLLGLSKLPRETSARILDGVLCARAHTPYEIRKEARVRAFIHLIEKGAPANAVSLSESDKQVDILDAAILLGPVEAAEAWLITHN